MLDDENFRYHRYFDFFVFHKVVESEGKGILNEFLEFTFTVIKNRSQ